MHCGAPYMGRGRQVSCSCASQTSSGSSARTRSWPSVSGSPRARAFIRCVAHAGRLAPLADRVVALRARVLELLPLNVNRLPGEEVVAAAVVEVQVRVDDDVDAGQVEGLLAQWDEAGVKVGHLRVQLRHAGVDQDSCGGMVDDVDVDR